ncbi:O-antigen ligase family protein [Jiella sp. MQZ9-1]|uniref:O-antigen ligase family protein n=1 Tax=Jiella flava TaxID=2816857 RepID=A0A939FZG4_9HYPH|nr:O-antigen ligase family protein [Jiella flava]MBO0663041.1 O-antigen ligase family protein [Jiella flava]MCD2471460.1 O-antigen ligase family protein [Jiella flava]
MPYSPNPSPAFTYPRSNPHRLGARRSDIALPLAALAVALAPINILRLDQVYFTASDAASLLAFWATVQSRSIRLDTLGPGAMLWNIGLALLGGMLFLSSLLFGDVTRGVILWAQYLFAYLVVALVVLSRPPGDVPVLVKVYLASIAIMCLHGIYVIDILHETNTIYVSGNGRLQGFMERENECSAVIAMTVPILLWATLSGHIRRRWAVLLLLLYSYAIVLTGSNTGLFSLILAIVLFTVFLGSWRHTATLIVGGAATAAIVLTWGSAFLPEVFQHRVLGALESGDIDQAGTFTGRLALIREALGMTDQTMLFGYGADQFRVISVNHAPVHDTYLLLWTEAGFPGMLGLLLMLSGGAIAALGAWPIERERTAAVAGLTSVLLFSLALNAMPHVYGRFFAVPLILGLAPALAAQRQSTSTSGRRSHRFRGAASLTGP